MTRRSMGWIQNPVDLNKLCYVTGIFTNGSDSNKDMRCNRLPLLLANGFISQQDYDTFINLLSNDHIVLQYAVLKGKGCGKDGRKNTKCTGILQAAIDGQKKWDIIDLNGQSVTTHKPYVDDWSADGYTRWAIATGLVIYDYSTDSCSISELGYKLVNANTEGKRKQYLTQALLSYPPISRILEILSDGNSYTKYELGSKIGFSDEMGFTSLNQNYVMALLNEASSNEDRKKIKDNDEGDVDKYARMMCSWLEKMGWVKSQREERAGSYFGSEYKASFTTYRITATGLKIYRQSCGNSSNKRSPKIVYYEMLATKAPDADFLRTRRANIIDTLRRPCSIQQILESLKRKDIITTPSTIEDDIIGLKRIGLHIVQKDGKYHLADDVQRLNIPLDTHKRHEMTELKDQVREKLKLLNHEYLVLIDLAFSNASRGNKNLDAREFEIKTAELFTKELGFNGVRLGESHKPDVVIWCDSNGCIIDNKSYKDGFNVDAGNADEMSRYVNQAVKRISGMPPNEWWRVFVDNNVDNLNFLFVTSFLKGNFKYNLNSISNLSGIKGGAIDVKNLLYYAESVKQGIVDITNFHKLFDNDEIIIYI